MTTSEKDIVPATSHWSFANVTVKTVAKKSPSTSGARAATARGTVEGDGGHAGVMVRPCRPRGTTRSGRPSQTPPTISGVRQEIVRTVPTVSRTTGLTASSSVTPICGIDDRRRGRRQGHDRTDETACGAERVRPPSRLIVAQPDGGDASPVRARFDDRSRRRDTARSYGGRSEHRALRRGHGGSSSSSASSPAPRASARDSRPCSYDVIPS